MWLKELDTGSRNKPLKTRSFYRGSEPAVGSAEGVELERLYVGRTFSIRRAQNDTGLWRGPSPLLRNASVMAGPPSAGHSARSSRTFVRSRGLRRLQS